MTRFSARGATFVTPGSGFELSGQPAPLLEELNPAYASVFAAFSAPRIFTPLDSNVMDAVFHVPGNTAVPAAVTGFGAVFTNVDVADTTRLRFYAPDGALLYERAVPATTGNATLSFLGVSFTAGAGGCVMAEENRALLRDARARVVWLCAAPATTLLERVRNGTHRPLLDDDPEGTLQRMFTQREAMYRDVADAIVLVDHRSVSEVVEAVLR